MCGTRQRVIDFLAHKSEGATFDELRYGVAAAGWPSEFESLLDNLVRHRQLFYDDQAMRYFLSDASINRYNRQQETDLTDSEIQGHLLYLQVLANNLTDVAANLQRVQSCLERLAKGKSA